MVQPKDIDKIKNPKCLLFCCQWSWSVRRLCNWGLVMKVGLQIRQITAKQFIPPHVHLLESLLTLNIWPWHGADLFWSRGTFSWMDLYFARCLWKCQLLHGKTIMLKCCSSIHEKIDAPRKLPVHGVVPAFGVAVDVTHWSLFCGHILQDGIDWSVLIAPFGKVLKTMVFCLAEAVQAGSTNDSACNCLNWLQGESSYTCLITV